MFVIGRKGGTHLVHNDFVYRSNMKRQGRNLNKMYWECIHNRSIKCRGRVKSVGNKLFVTNGLFNWNEYKMNETKLIVFLLQLTITTNMMLTDLTQPTNQDV